MIPITLLKWDWVTLCIGLSRSSTHYSHIVDVSLVWCMLLKLKQQKDIRMRVWLGTSTYIKKNTSLSLPIKDYMGVILIIYIMYKLMGNGGLWTWMHFYNYIGYTFPFPSLLINIMYQINFIMMGLQKL